ncbi:Niemann-Pick C2 protein, partial [Paragonimus westermani]
SAWDSIWTEHSSKIVVSEHAFVTHDGTGDGEGSAQPTHLCLSDSIEAMPKSITFPSIRTGSQAGVLKSVDVVPCDTKPCTLYKKENAQIIITFSAKRRIDHGKVVVHGVIEGVPIPFPLDHTDMCEFTQPTCPLEPSGQVYTYSYSLPVKSTYPSIRLDVKWQLQDNNEDIICALIPVQISS